MFHIPPTPPLPSPPRAPSPPSLTIRHRIQRPPTTRPVTLASIILQARVHLTVINHSRPSSTRVLSTDIYLSPTYDRLLLIPLLLIIPYHVRPSHAINNNSGDHSTATASSKAPLISYPLRVLPRFQSIEDPARPALPPVLVGNPFMQRG